MSRINARIETSVTQTGEHKKFLKEQKVRNVSTSKTKTGGKFLCFSVQNQDDLAKVRKACKDNKYNLIVD